MQRQADAALRQRTNGDAPRRRGLFDGELTRVMRRLDTDRSPEAVLDASLVYNHFVEGISALAGYRRWNQRFKDLDGKLPGLEQGIGLTQRDERRHIAYGTYLCRRIIAEHPETWSFVENRWAELTAHIVEADQQGGGYDGAATVENVRYRASLAKRRLDALSVARTMRPEDIESSSIEDFVPEELVNA